MGGGEDSWLVGMYSLSGPEIPNKQVLTATARSEWTFVIPWTCTSESHQSVFSNTRTDVLSLRSSFNVISKNLESKYFWHYKLVSSEKMYNSLQYPSWGFVKDSFCYVMMSLEERCKMKYVNVFFIFIFWMCFPMKFQLSQHSNLVWGSYTSF